MSHCTGTKIKLNDGVVNAGNSSFVYDTRMVCMRITCKAPWLIYTCGNNRVNPRKQGENHLCALKRRWLLHSAKKACLIRLETIRQGYASEQWHRFQSKCYTCRKVWLRSTFMTSIAALVSIDNIIASHWLPLCSFVWFLAESPSLLVPAEPSAPCIADTQK